MQLNSQHMAAGTTVTVYVTAGSSIVYGISGVVNAAIPVAFHPTLAGSGPHYYTMWMSSNCFSAPLLVANLSLTQWDLLLEAQLPSSRLTWTLSVASTSTPALSGAGTCIFATAVPFIAGK